MKANELRIGNWIKKSVTGENYKDYEINKGYEIDNVEHYLPIPLTEEWLLKFGFEKYEAPKILGDSFIFDIGRKRRISVSNIDNPNQMIFLCGYDEHNINIDLVCLWNFDYDGKINVHQLQNLYFALTGEELNPSLSDTHKSDQPKQE